MLHRLSNSWIIGIMILVQCLFTGCYQAKNTPQEEMTHDGKSLQSGYNMILPADWKEVIDREEIKKRVLWSLNNYNYTVFAEHPTFRAWDGPAQTNSFLTIMALKRHRDLGLGHWYNDVILFLKEMGATIQETGVTSLDDRRCKWWIHDFAGGAIHQQCFLVCHGPYVYILCFTTSYMSDEKRKLFEQLAQKISFIKGI